MHSNKKPRINTRKSSSRTSLPSRKAITLPKKSVAPSKLERSVSHSHSSVAKVKLSKEKGKAPETYEDPANTSSLLLNNTGAPPSTFKIVAGSYEKLLYGLEGTFPTSSEDSVDDNPNPTASSNPIPVLKPIFIFPAHVGCVKAVAASPHGGKWLATGSADEIIKVWDLRRRKEIGGLMQHQGSITHLSFPSRSHLLSASEDGTLALFRARDWTLLRSFKGHKDRVNCVAVHPSGKLALSVGKDRTIRMWDFMRGKGSASVKIGKEGELIRWSPSGAIFAVQSLSDVDIYSTKMALLCQIHHSSRVQDIRFFSRAGSNEELLLVAAEDKKISVYQADQSEGTDVQYQIVAEFIGHVNRVKAIDTLLISLPNGQTTTYMSTVSSDGKILLYDLSQLPSSTEPTTPIPTIQPITSYDTKGTRLTCVTMGDGEVPIISTNGQKRKRSPEDESSASEDVSSGDEDGEEGKMVQDARESDDEEE